MLHIQKIMYNTNLIQWVVKISKRDTQLRGRMLKMDLRGGEEGNLRVNKINTLFVILK